MNLNEIKNTLVCNFNDRPEFHFSEIKDNSFRVRVSDTPFKLIIYNDGEVKIQGKGTDVHGDILNYTGYDDLVDILLDYAI